jgi:hypothetical protein
MLYIVEPTNTSPHMVYAAVCFVKAVQLNNMPGRSQLHPIRAVDGIGKGPILIIFQSIKKQLIAAGTPRP